MRLLGYRAWITNKSSVKTGVEISMAQDIHPVELENPIARKTICVCTGRDPKRCMSLLATQGCGVRLNLPLNLNEGRPQ